MKGRTASWFFRLHFEFRNSTPSSSLTSPIPLLAAAWMKWVGRSGARKAIELCTRRVEITGMEVGARADRSCYRPALRCASTDQPVPRDNACDRERPELSGQAWTGARANPQQRCE